MLDPLRSGGLPPWSIARVDREKNLLPNPLQNGAIVGGALPTEWSTADATSGTSLAASIVGKGVEGRVPYVDWRISGTSGTVSDAFSIYWITSSKFPAVSGDILDFSIFLSLVRGSITPFINGQIYSDDFDAGFGYLGGNYSVTPFTTLTRRPLNRGLYTQRHTKATVGGTQSNGYLAMNFTANLAVDLTFRLGYPIVRKVN